MIRLLDNRFLDAILVIEQESFAIPWTREMFAAEFTQPFTRMWGWFEEDRLTGYLLAWSIFDEFHIANLAVARSARRKGIAEALLCHALEWAQANQAVRSLLEVRRSNHAARGLYEKFGYHLAAVRVDYYECPIEDALILERRL
jgi:ribosomal-protein-alanine N-acetyltransferase